MKMNPVVHFEMPAKDKKRVAEFYTNAFGWKMQHMGKKMGDYVLASTTESREDGRPKEPGAINGGFFQHGDEGTEPHLVIAVDDLKKHMKIVTDAGGTLQGKPMDIPGVGSFIMFIDTEGNKVGMLQPTM